MGYFAEVFAGAGGGDHGGRAVVRVAASSDHPTVPKVAVTVTSAAHKAGLRRARATIAVQLGLLPGTDRVGSRAAPQCPAGFRRTPITPLSTRRPRQRGHRGTGTGTGTGVSGRDCQPG